MLKPAKKLLAEIVPYYSPITEEAPSGLHVCSSCDESSYFDSVEEEVLRLYEAITGGPLEVD